MSTDNLKMYLYVYLPAMDFFFGCWVNYRVIVLSNGSFPYQALIGSPSKKSNAVDCEKTKILPNTELSNV